MRHLNETRLIGNVGNTPEFTQPDDLAVCKFSLATTRKWKDKNSGEIKEKTCWHNIVCFGKNAEYARDYISKGAECFVGGEIDNYSYQKDDATTGYGSQIIANQVSANRYEKKADSAPAQQATEKFPAKAVAAE